jgi:hypothetical protein
MKRQAGAWRVIAAAVATANLCWLSPVMAKTKAHPPGVRGWADVPAICRQKPRALDDVGAAVLVDLERHLVRDVLADDVADHNDGAINSVELREILRSHPATQMVFLFPAPIALPNTSYNVQMGGAVEDLARASHPVFYMQVSDVRQVGRGKQIGIVLKYASWPTGTPPQGIIWMWGITGKLCVLQEKGGWHGYSIGPLVVSELLDHAAGRRLAQRQPSAARAFSPLPAY